MLNWANAGRNGRPSRGKRVIVHRGKCRRMNFTKKNFQYVEMDFDDFVLKADSGGNDGQDGEAPSRDEFGDDTNRVDEASAECAETLLGNEFGDQTKRVNKASAECAETPLRDELGDDTNRVDEASAECAETPSRDEFGDEASADRVVSPDEWFYLRSLGTDPRKDVSDISVGFPELAPDFVAPPFVPDGAFFSSVFRIASPGMQLWTHYDVMDNILVQIRGRKRVVLFPPSDALKLYLKGDKSLVIDIDDPDLNEFPRFAEVTRHECFLEPGDVLFIPALWFHNVTSLDFGVAINIFWRHLPPECYDPKDVYGNRDPVPASRVMQSLDKNLQTLEKLPAEYRDFYARRMIARIEEKFDLEDNRL